MFATVLHVVCVGFFLLHTLHIDFVCLLSDSEPVDLTMSSPERGPSLERFYGRDKVSDDVSDLEGELIEHTTAVVRERIEQRSETLIADIWTQSKQEVTKVKEGKVKRKVKRRRKRGHDWSKKEQRLPGRLAHNTRPQTSDATHTFLLERVWVRHMLHVVPSILFRQQWEAQSHNSLNGFVQTRKVLLLTRGVAVALVVLTLRAHTYCNVSCC